MVAWSLGWLVVWMLGWLLGQLVGWVVGCLVSWLAKLKEANYNAQGSTTDIYEKLCKAITDTAQEVLPKVRRKQGAKRKVSKKTRDLYTNVETSEERSATEREELKKKRKDAGLADFTSWVQDCADRLNHANGHGDTKEVYNLVKQMEGKPGKPPKNLTTDGQGNILADANAVAARWYSFLKIKFSATTAEQGRPDMPILPQAAEDSKLTEAEALKAISKLSAGKACGPDGIPGEVYKHVSVCKTMLVTYLG